MPFGADGDYSEQTCQELVNAYLANRLGNLCSRTFKLFEKNLSGNWSSANLSENSWLARKSLALPDQVKEHMINLNPSEALASIFKLIDDLNLNLSEIKPWNLFKDQKAESQTLAQQTVLETIASLRIIANLLFPFLPDLSSKMLAIFGLENPNSWEEIKQWNFLGVNHKFNQLRVLFARIE